MVNVPVFYATTEGHTRRIAEAIASTLRERGFASEARELTANMAPLDWLDITAAVIGASLHGGRHQKAAARFVRREAPHLNARPTAFFSVSLSAASADSGKVDVVRGIAAKFVRDHGWQPHRMVCFGGKLAYSQYGLLKRWLMKRIAGAEGGPTDTARDYDLTDWKAVRDFAASIAEDLNDRREQRAAS